MKPTQKQAEQYAAQIALLIAANRLPSLEQVQAAILSTAAEYEPLIAVGKAPRKSRDGA
jgi:hypothetical protein